MRDGPVSPWSVPLSVVTYTVPSAPTARPPGAPGEPTGANTVIEPGGSGAAVDAAGGGAPAATSVDAPAAVERSPTPVALGPGVAGTKVGGGAGPVAADGPEPVAVAVGACSIGRSGAAADSRPARARSTGGMPVTPSTIATVSAMSIV